MAGYSPEFKEMIARTPKTLGVQLLRWAVSREFSILQISQVLGCTRQTAYNWASGKEVTNAYRERVQALLEIIRGSATAEQAWKRACIKFSIKQ